MSDEVVTEPQKDKCSINGLTYTKMGLIALFGWLLWGDFCFSMMEILKPKLLPLLLQKESFGLNASSFAFMIMFGTIPGITGILIGPAVSFKSDRYRGRKGRRIPFITWTMVPLVLSLFGIGLGTHIRDFLAGTWYRPQTVTVRAPGDAADEGAHTSVITYKVTSTGPVYDGIAVKDLSMALEYTSPVNISQSDKATEVDETGPYWGLFGPSWDTYTVVLRSKPTADVTITAHPDRQVDLGEGPGAAISLTFTADNWDSSQKVKVQAVDDEAPEGPHKATITHTAASADPTYNGVAIDDLVVDVTDNDQAGATISDTRDETEVREFGTTSDKYTVVLDTKPTADVTITATPDVQTDLGAGPGKPVTLTFTPRNWDSVQTVNVTAVDDSVPEGPHESTIRHTVTSADSAYNGIKVDDLVAQVADNDRPEFIITESKKDKDSPESTDVRENGTSSDRYTVVLGTVPTADVTITVTPDAQTDLGEGPGEAVELTFAQDDWDEPQTVTVTAVDDDASEGPHVSTITHTATSADLTYNGMAIDDVVANVADNDRPGITITRTDDEKDPTKHTYAVVLDSEPAEDVAIALAPDSQTDLGAGSGEPLTLTFRPPQIGLWGLDPIAITVLLIGVFVAIFHCMDEFVNCVYWYLFADVVPEAFIGRFAALFRLVGVGATSLFMLFIFPYAETHFSHIFFGIGLLYLFGFGLMCTMVKEGEYPPPDDIGENPGVLKQAKIYVTECFSHKIYVNLFLYSIFSYMGMILALANVVIFHTDGIGLSLDQIGKVIGIIGIATAILAYPSGWLVDRFNALRVTLLMVFPILAFQAVSFFFMRDFPSFVVLEGGKAVFMSLIGAAMYPMLIVVFPKDKFGQFSSCNGAMRSVAMMFAAPLLGLILDRLTQGGADKFAFRWTYMLGAICYACAIFFLYNVYVIWKSRGGTKGYVAPGSALEKQQLAKAAAEQSAGAKDEGETNR